MSGSGSDHDDIRIERILSSEFDCQAIVVNVEVIDDAIVPT